MDRTNEILQTINSIKKLVRENQEDKYIGNLDDWDRGWNSALRMIEIKLQNLLDKH